MKIAVLGAGAWGTALAIAFSGRHDVSLWTRGEADIAHLRATRTSRYLPEGRLPEAVAIEGDLARAVDGADILLLATATAGLRETAAAVARVRPQCAVVWACKGFENPSRLLPHEVIAQAMPRSKAAAALSGPSFALEVARGQPTAVVLASADAAFAAETAAALNGERLRLYSSGDLVGVELGGAVKNVIAIAAGISDGLQLGRNARAALVTRGLAEIVRLGVAVGGRPETFMGLAGLGDLVLTCTGDLSRNREVGLRLAQDQRLPDILGALGHVAEGVQSAPAVLALARARDTEMPITEAVNAVLFDGLRPGEAVRGLLARDPRPE